MDNEVVIHVRVKNEGKTGFEAVQKNANESASTISKSFSERLTEGIRTNITQRLGTVFGQSGGIGETLGTTLGDRISERMSTRITERITRDSNGRWRDAVTGRYARGADGGDGGRGGAGGDAKVNVDVDKQSLFSRMFSAGKEGAGKFVDGFKGGISSLAGGVFSGDVISSLLKGLTVVGLAAVLAPIIGAAVTTAVGLALGGGAIAIGIAGAFKDPRIKLAAKGTMEEIKGIVAEYSANFRGPLENFLAGSGQGGSVGLVGVLEGVRGQISQLGKDLAPVADRLGNGIIGMLQNLLPPVLRGIEYAQPIVDALADKLPGLGKDIGYFFERIMQGGPGASVFFRDLIDLLGWLLRVIANIIYYFTELYGVARRVFSGLVLMAADTIQAIASAFDWIPGLGPKLQGAADATRRFADKMNNNLKGIDDDITITLRFRVLGQAAASAAVRTAQILAGHMGGGIVGAATGGLHGGLRMVGEHGPELVQLPPGTRVNSNPDTERMLGQGGGGGDPIVVQLMLDGRVLAEQLVEPQRELVRGKGRGSVQSFYGVAGAT